MRTLLLTFLLCLCPSITAQMPAIGGGGGIVNLPGGGVIAMVSPIRSPLAMTSPIIDVVALDDAFVAFRADGTLVSMSIDGSVTDLGRFEIGPIPVRGTSFDYVVPEDKAYTVHQDCANMSLKTCIKRFLAAIKALRGALGLK